MSGGQLFPPAIRSQFLSLGAAETNNTVTTMLNLDLFRSEKGQTPSATYLLTFINFTAYAAI